MDLWSRHYWFPINIKQSKGKILSLESKLKEEKKNLAELEEERIAINIEYAMWMFNYNYFFNI